MTAYSDIYDRFKRRIEHDRDFFRYINVFPETAELIIERRCSSLLKEAVELFELKCIPKVDLSERNGEGFTADLNGSEIYILSSLMYQQYLERDIAKLKTLSVNYTSANLKVFDPSNARSTFQDLYQTVCNQNNIYIDAYASRDRENGGYLGIDYSAYPDSDG